MENPRRPVLLVPAVLPTDEQGDGDALLDIEDVFVLAAVRRLLLLLAVAVQVEQVDIVEAAQQALAHIHEGGIVEIAVVGDEAEHAMAGLLDAPLREADELHVIVRQPLGLRWLLQGRAALVLGHQFLDPLALVGRVAGIGRIAQHHHHRQSFFTSAAALASSASQDVNPGSLLISWASSSELVRKTPNRWSVAKS
jgi:hypothetical protein